MLPTLANIDALRVESIAALLPPDVRRWFDVRVIESTASTNSDLLRDCAALPSGTVLAAEHQTAGRGRRGRAWVAPPEGSLAFSVLWKFRGNAAALAGLSLAVGVAAARAITQCGAAGIALKWPNDLLAWHDGGWAKLGGILIELKTGPDAVSGTAGTADAASMTSAPGTSSASRAADTVSAVIGIGINIDLGAAAAGIGQPVTDVRALGCGVSRNALLAALLQQLGSVLPQFAQQGFAPLAAEWNQLHAWRGQVVQLMGEGGAAVAGATAGIAQGVAHDGALLLDTPAGMVRAISGDVSLRLAPLNRP